MSTIPATPAETTGEILLTWGPEGPAVTAPDQAAIPALELFATAMAIVAAYPGEDLEAV